MKILKFYSDSCGPCKVLTKNLKEAGIDVENITHVINFELPVEKEAYVHRIGRSGRFGHLGIAISFITDDDVNNFYAIQKDLDTEIEAMPQSIDRNLYAV